MKKKDLKEQESKGRQHGTLEVQGSVYDTFYTKKFLGRKTWEKPDPNKIWSFIPGTVVEIAVREGQKVDEGQLLVVFEAMKMKNRILAPHAGKIKSIFIKEGERIPKGHTIIEME